MLTPEYLERVPDSLVLLYQQAEEDILRRMAARIAATDLYIPTTQWQAQKLRELGVTQSEITARLAALTGKTNAEIARLMQESEIGRASCRERV